MNGSAKTRLSLMMFLQYAVWGAWLPIAARFLQASTEEGGLGFTGGQVGTILGVAGSVGAVTSPFIAGQIADRYFSAEKFLALLLAVGAVVKWVTAYQTSFAAWLILSIAYSVVYMPTLALSNSVAFANLSDTKKDFPKVRVWGTIGWIAASWIFPMFWLTAVSFESSWPFLDGLSFQWMPPFFAGNEVDHVTARLVDALKFSGMISLGYAAFCFLLPHTPPKRDAVESLAFAKAFALFRKPSFALLVLASLPVSIIHQIYFMQTAPFLSSIGLKDSLLMPAMTVGQFAEIAVMAGLGFMLKRLGFRWVIFIGAFAYFARYAIFGTVGLPLGVIVASQALHGFCYACFFAAGFIYVDRLATDDIRHSVQTVYGIIILGLGPVLGGRLLGWLETQFTSTEGIWDYTKLWYTLGVIGLFSGLLVAAFFRDETPPDADPV